MHIVVSRLPNAPPPKMDFFLVVGVMIPKSINPDACHENCIILYT